MSRNARIVIGLMVVCALVVGLFGYWASMRRAKQTASAVATVVEARKDAKSGKRGKDSTVVTLAYRAGSTLTQGRARVSGVHLDEYPAGRSVTICYDPADTDSLRIDDGPCG